MLSMNLTTQIPLGALTPHIPLGALTPHIPLGALTPQIPLGALTPHIPSMNLTGSPEPQMFSKAPQSPKSPKTPRPVPMATPDVKGYKTKVTCVPPDLDEYSKICEMVCKEESTISNCYIPCDLVKTMTINDLLSSCCTYCEEPQYFIKRLCRGAATSVEDKVTLKLSEHQEMSAKPQDTETPTVRERKKRDETPSESSKSEEEVPKSSPGGEEQRGSSSSSQGDAEPESESSGWRWERVIFFFPKVLDSLRRLGAAVTGVRKIVMLSLKIVFVFCAAGAIFVVYRWVL